MTLSQNKRRPVIVGPNIPEISNETDVWINTSNNTLYRYDGSVWNIISSASAVSGSAGYTYEQIQDAVAPLLDHASHTNLTASYDDAENKVLLTVPSESIQDAAASLLTHSNHTNITASYNDSFNRVELTNTALDPTTASATYLTQANASTTYLTQAAGLTAASASATYLTQTNASATYIRQSNQQSIINSASAAAVNYLVGTAPSTLDTLQELAAAVNNDPNFTVSVANGIANKLDTSTYASASPNFLTTSTASPVYLTQSSASANYLSQSLASTVYQGAPFRNILHNGAMQISQRGTTAITGISTTGTLFTMDRYRNESTAMVSILAPGAWTQDIQNDAPTGSGFRRSLRLLCTTADTGPSSALAVSQVIEGQNVQRLKKGTSAAEQLTLSFWVKSNRTGTFICELYDQDNFRTVSQAYTISASATWERKVLTFPADTTGVLDNDANASLKVLWFLAADSTYTSSGTLGTTWTNLTHNTRAFGQTNLASAINNYWQITGAQLEIGNTATPFEFKSYGDDLRDCQRYYWRVSGNANSLYPSVTVSAVAQTTTNVIGTIQNPVPMRDTPSAVNWSTLAYQRWDGTVFAVSNIAVDTNTDTQYGFSANFTVATTTAATAGKIIGNNSANSFFDVVADNF